MRSKVLPTAAGFFAPFKLYQRAQLDTDIQIETPNIELDVGDG
jgi:hypothetical protein